MDEDKKIKAEDIKKDPKIFNGHVFIPTEEDKKNIKKEDKDEKGTN